jgi:hypothetical protein
MSKKIFYNTSYFKFFRRQIKPIEMEKEFINLINSKNENNYPITERNVYPKEKKINLDIFFQKHSIDLIKKIVDLFVEFDIDKSNSFDRFEFFKMFNINKIPIKMDEIIYLFKFNAQKKTISFFELINLTFNPDFDLRYKEVISKIKPRLELGIICPNDFSEMLSHLCEFGKLSADAKKIRKSISKPKKIELNSLINNNNKHYIKSKTKDEINNIKTITKIGKNIINKISFNINKEDYLKKSSKKLIYNRNRNKNIMESFTDPELFKTINKFKEEENYMVNNYKTILEIAKKKLIRNELLFKNINYRNKYEKSKKNLAKSIDTLYKINPNINNTYISYNPLKQKFINLNTGNDYDFKIINNYKSKILKNNKTENFSNYKPILMKIDENHIKNKYNLFRKNI